jgi:acetoin utilization deacetylase AcuC-like enzyme
LVIVSAGFDYVSGDPVGDLGVDVSAAARLAGAINEVAQTYCNGRVAYVLEGGYDTRALAASVGAILDAHSAGAGMERAAAPQAIPQPQQIILSNITSTLRE